MLKIISWHWRGWRGHMYNVSHFNILDRMLRDNLSIDYEFCVVTDDPDNSSYNMKTIPLIMDEKLIVKTRDNHPNCFLRLKMFDRSFIKNLGKEGDYIVSMDVDVIVMNKMDSLFESKEKFKSLKGLYVPYSAGMIMHRLGENAELYDDFNGLSSLYGALNLINKESGYRYVGSDQAWISMKLKDSNYPRWSTEDGCYSVSWDREQLRNDRIPKNCIIVQTPGSRKPESIMLKSFNKNIYNKYLHYSKSLKEKEEVFNQVFTLKNKSVYGRQGDSILINDVKLYEKLYKRNII